MTSMMFIPKFKCDKVRRYENISSPNSRTFPIAKKGASKEKRKFSEEKLSNGKMSGDIKNIWSDNGNA